MGGGYLSKQSLMGLLLSGGLLFKLSQRETKGVGWCLFKVVFTGGFCAYIVFRKRQRGEGVHSSLWLQ